MRKNFPLVPFALACHTITPLPLPLTSNPCHIRQWVDMASLGTIRDTPCLSMDMGMTQGTHTATATMVAVHITEDILIT